MADNPIGPVRVNAKGTSYPATRRGDVVTIERYTPGGGDPHPPRVRDGRWVNDQAIDPQPPDALAGDNFAELLGRITDALRARSTASGGAKWSRGGGFRSRSSLVKAFDQVGKAIGLGHEVSPRAMRRTFQDLARAAELKDVVTRSISGHATPAMQRHYSTVNDTEMREGIAKVIDIATGRERRAA